MNILLVFATYSGGTRLAADVIENTLKSAHNVTKVELLDDTTFPTLNDYDLVIVGSPSWLDEENKQGRPHKHIISFMKHVENEKFTGKKFAVFALGDWFYAHFAGSADYLKTFILEREGVLLLPELRIDKYQYFKDNSEKRCKEWAEKIREKLESL